VVLVVVVPAAWRVQRVQVEPWAAPPVLLELLELRHPEAPAVETQEAPAAAVANHRPPAGAATRELDAELAAPDREDRTGHRAEAAAARLERSAAEASAEAWATAERQAVETSAASAARLSPVG
jgi:hypothetical protein